MDIIMIFSLFFGQIFYFHFISVYLYEISKSLLKFIIKEKLWI